MWAFYHHAPVSEQFDLSYLDYDAVAYLIRHPQDMGTLNCKDLCSVIGLGTPCCWPPVDSVSSSEPLRKFPSSLGASPSHGSPTTKIKTARSPPSREGQIPPADAVTSNVNDLVEEVPPSRQPGREPIGVEEHRKKGRRDPPSLEVDDLLVSSLIEGTLSTDHFPGSNFLFMLVNFQAELLLLCIELTQLHGELIVARQIIDELQTVIFEEGFSDLHDSFGIWHRGPRQAK
ncbi:uncharacterized protein G2W53_008003 [Senna tora]|uniref:Uncharacterized protein n=1 Tax=Senna tora TaxID=362788 RepID=A0A835CFF4_9FABA|nr:uncharacterized protein G2W53_008003 [Senna tora]